MNAISISFILPTQSNPAQIWQYFIELNLRKLWETDLEDFRIIGELKTGAKGIFKLQNMPEMEVTLSKVINEQEFTEQFDMPDIGLLFFSHQIIQIAENQYALKAEISLKPDPQLDTKASYDFIKQISDDIIDKTYKLNSLVER
ncbi:MULTISPECIES: hypothetical protein [unclassified Gilliamella]|uniref:hypothetical protein n=1 Tax=unclassified Gilliamella TaxID=2685620 RepID=UPI00226AF22C|nr:MULTISPECIES: hypothetical protein [unclassified Gilliamella]MCX8602398.1 hypothetical protein [Gilliamella sp. B3722]MCX8608213.1 hypothetical protein [Gilliamella sp. B3771]MCX8611644.1 hypothetical protein [Gilliamella sp. B3891]MCX8614076.1 hypothetical protein [Gilliamella sp. B3773]MCX8616200.1 hypothetical protein [Gilliamella sp. B3770]